MTSRVLSRQSRLWTASLAPIAAGAIALLALWLRSFRLDAQSYWYDEGISVALAPRSLEVITRSAAADIHPPLYYYLLHWWVRVAGTSEFSTRYLSVLCGVLLVALVFALGKRLAGTEVGVLTSLLTALSPFLVYYSQEARMYSLAALLAALSFYLFLRLVDGPSPFRERLVWAGYLTATILGVYSHYYVFTVLLAQNLYVVVWMVWRVKSGDAPRLSRVRGSLLKWGSAQIAVLVAYAPWLAVSYRQLLGWPSISEPFGLVELVSRLFRVFSLGLSWDAAATPNREAVFIGLAVAGLLHSLIKPRSKSLWAVAVALLYLVVPVLVMYLASLSRPMYNPKFLLLAVPGYSLLLALGVYSLSRAGYALVAAIAGQRLGLSLASLVAVVSVGGVVFSTSRSLEAYYFDPKYARDDYRGLVQYVESHWREGDVLVLNAPGQAEIVAHYFTRGTDLLHPLPKQRPMVEEKTRSDLESIRRASRRVWLVLWATQESDPEQFVERWLDSHMFKSESRWYGSVRLVQYSGEVPADEGGRQVSALQMGDAILLRSYSPLQWQGEPEGTIPVSLEWVCLQPIAERYKVFVQLLDEGEFLWGQHDAEPGGGYRLTIDWRPGETIEDRHGLIVLTGTPPGVYSLQVGMYDLFTGKRLPVKDQDGNALGDRVLFGRVLVDVATSRVRLWDASIVPRQQVARFGPLELAGFSLNRLGEEVQLDEYHQSDVAHLTLYWRAVESISEDYSIEVALRAPGGDLLPVSEMAPSFARYPTSEWSAGELVRQQSRLRFGGQVPGEYGIVVGVAEASGRLVSSKPSSASVYDGRLEIGRFRLVAP